MRTAGYVSSEEEVDLRDEVDRDGGEEIRANVDEANVIDGDDGEDDSIRNFFSSKRKRAHPTQPLSSFNLQP